MAFFGFVPSEALLSNIQHSIEKKNSSDSLYPLRDETALYINDEIIDAILTDLIRHFPASDKRDTAEKLAGYIKSTVAVLLKQLLGKAPNDTVVQSINFSERSLFQDPKQLCRVGLALDPTITTALKQHFAQIQAEQTINPSQLVQHYKQFADATIQHFMVDFNKTLDLGLIKRKASDIAAIAVTKAVHIAIDKLIPQLDATELRALADYHDTLFFND